MYFIKIILLFIFVLDLYSNEVYIDSITLSKIKKTVNKEEAVASAYKKYLLDKGTIPSISDLIENDYLPTGFSILNPFGKEISISTVNDNTIVDSLPSNLKSSVYDYYYSNVFRKNSFAPMSFDSNNVGIELSTFEEFIFENKDNITLVKDDARNKYHLENGVLSWYNSTNKYMFTHTEDKLIVDDEINILDTNGNIDVTFLALVNDVMYAGETIYHEENGLIEDYINIGGNNNKIIKLDEEERNIGKTIIQFTRRAGGMIVNGDIYTWGNNANRITGIDINNYTKDNGITGSRYPVITGLVRARVKSYNSDFDNINYFSSPLRPKFIDFFSTVYVGTCGIDTNGILYCGSTTGLDTSIYGLTYTDIDDTKTSGEVLYKSKFFNGESLSPKAKKIFSNNTIWLILSKEGDIYRWGKDYSGFSGIGQLTFDTRNYTVKEPKKITENISGVQINDITYLLTIGYRKMGAISSTGDIYIWGNEYFKDNSTTDYESYPCSVSWEGIAYNLCSPQKITITNSTLTSPVTFESIKGGLQSFVAQDSDGNYYKIYQPKTKKINVELVSDIIQNNYTLTNADSEILSVDFSSKLNGSSLEENKGIVWINGNNELKGDYFTSENINDNLFKDAIKKIKWKKIKVIDDDNGMCGIDIYNQMYCWGIMSFYRNDTTSTDSLDKMGNTFMIPVFNTNLYDLNKDYLVAEGDMPNILTNMTSNDWSTTNDDGISGAFFMKYPTYIGGFNYEFEFK